jgi:hypothetical protein
VTEEVQHIFELSIKIRGLQDWAKAQPIRRAPNSERAIGDLAGIARSTLKTNIDKEQMSFANQEALAKTFGFKVTWPEWRDPDAIRTTDAKQRRDTAKAFLDRFLMHKSQPSRLTIEAGLTQKYIDRRFADFSFAVSGSFEPSPNTDMIPLVLSLSFDRRGWPVPFEGKHDALTVGLKEADLQIFHNRESAKVEARAIGCHSNAEGNFEGKVEGLAPWWIINVVTGDEPWLMGKRLRNDGEDCICRGLRIGDTIRAEMTARVNDCFVRVAGEPFEDIGEAKKRFIEHLAKLTVLNGAEVLLAEQTLTVVDHS